MTLFYALMLCVTLYDFMSCYVVNVTTQYVWQDFTSSSGNAPDVNCRMYFHYVRRYCDCKKKSQEWHFFWGRQVYFYLGWKNILSLGAFTKLRKATVSFVVSVRLSSWNNSALTGRILMKFHSYCDFFENLSTWFQVLWKSNKNNGYFTWRRFHIYDIILLNSS
jgi:hypothetical protein